MTASTPGFCSPIEFSIPPASPSPAALKIADPRLERRALAADGAETLDLDDLAIFDP